jgi:hypothetical protein
MTKHRDPQIGDDGWYDDWPEWAKNPLSEPSRHIPWRDMPAPRLNQNEKTRRYVQWMRLTHNGRRLPSTPVCSECGDRMSEAEVEQYRREFTRTSSSER